MQEVVNRMLRGVGPEALGSKVHFACVDASIVPPPAFAGCWSSLNAPTFADNEVSESEPWLSEASLRETCAILVFADPSDVKHSEAVVSLGEYLRKNPYVAPPVFMIPVVGAQGSLVDPATKQGITALLSKAYVDDIIIGTPVGYALGFAVQANLSNINTQLSRLGNTVQTRASRLQDRDQLASTIEYTTWSYLRSKCFHAIPRLRPNVDEDEHHVGSIRLGPKLGRGLFGVVRLATRGGAEDQAQGRYCNMMAISKSRQRSFREMAMINNYLCLMGEMNTFRHPNLSYLLAVIHTPRRLCICTETCGTRTLFLILRQSDTAAKEGREPGAVLSSGAIVALIRQVSDAVGHLHSVVRTCHRDIKPENLTLSDDISGAGLTVKLGGFELAMSQQDNQRCKTACGTLPFAAPEAIVSDTNGYDGMAADMWSLGILLMEVACGLRSVEQALELASHGGAEQNSDKKAQPPKPSLEVANKIRATFDEANFLGQFFAKCTPEARKVQDWLMPVVATLVRTNPLRRLDASALRDLMSSAPAE
mmetsp:Transcript_47516/g.152634  ORF Transcript_47516/g.152634 Transcript_47516/m.152634 type:complete len:536 (-) Transcript_47516:454-2061(-)